MLEDYDDGVIEVQVIPQDDNWGETATTITGNLIIFNTFWSLLINRF